MATKTISILETAYESLRKEKKEGESFSETILRLTRRRPRLGDSFGKWTMSAQEARSFRAELKKAWGRFGQR